MFLLFDMRLRNYGDVSVLEPDDEPEEELIVIDLDDADAREEPQPLGWRIVDQHGNVMGGNQ